MPHLLFRVASVDLQGDIFCIHWPLGCANLITRRLFKTSTIEGMFFNHSVLWQNEPSISLKVRSVRWAGRHIEARYSMYLSKIELMVMFDNWLTRQSGKSGLGTDSKIP